MRQEAEGAVEGLVTLECWSHEYHPILNHLNIYAMLHIAYAT